MPSISFWNGKKVLVTGHTGFKGAWLCLWLKELGAHVVGVSDQSWGPDTIYETCGLKKILINKRYNLPDFSDITEFHEIREIIKKVDPEVIFHLAAQPLVLDAYINPRDTYLANLMGTLNVLESARYCSSLSAVVSVTTDKVYENDELAQGFTEESPLGGHDPYSASKACADILSRSHGRSFFDKLGVGLAVARAGNVIGGGDWSSNRLVPDIMRSAFGGGELLLRHPDAVRPWQHVLDPLHGYLLLAEKLTIDGLPDHNAFNFGPDEQISLTVGEIVDAFSKKLRRRINVKYDNAGTYHEASYLTLNSAKSQHKLGWRPVWRTNEAIEYTSEWYMDWHRGADLTQTCCQQIQKYTAAT